MAYNAKGNASYHKSSSVSSSPSGLGAPLYQAFGSSDEISNITVKNIPEISNSEVKLVLNKRAKKQTPRKSKSRSGSRKRSRKD